MLTPCDLVMRHQKMVRQKSGQNHIRWFPLTYPSVPDRKGEDAAAGDSDSRLLSFRVQNAAFRVTFVVRVCIVSSGEQFCPRKRSPGFHECTNHRFDAES